MIKVAFVNFWKQYDYTNSVLMKILKKHFNVMVTMNNPDFVVASTFGDIKNVLRYECPRIFYCGEPRTPDFSLFDYGIGSDFLTILDKNGKNRFYRFPVAFTEWHSIFAADLCETIDSSAFERIVKNKSSFCNFIEVFTKRLMDD